MNQRRIIASLACSGVLFALAVVGCKAPSSDPSPSASAAPAALERRAPAPAVKEKPWFSGGFSGQYQAKVAAVEVKVGALKEWAKDDGKLSSGPGKLELTIDEAGLVDGTSEGALGAGRVSGRVEGDTLRVQLSPTDDSGLHGVLVAPREGDGFKGSIEASSGDSLRVRTASIELKKLTN
ncbi:MAG TPA: hypothetical protein VEQ59_22715 [Polyangiaceae bacterium]|nr:hypothetical protein [Polyangiaceae bacterium]